MMRYPLTKHASRFQDLSLLLLLLRLGGDLANARHSKHRRLGERVPRHRPLMRLWRKRHHRLIGTEEPLCGVVHGTILLRF